MICVDEISKTYTIRSLKKGKFLSYEKKVIPALQNVSFSIADGESVGYVGLNGSGKSTTIKLLAGILCPDSGQIRINGKDPFRDKSLCYEIGAVFGQKQQLWMDLPVGDSFEMLRSIYHVSKSDHTYRMKMIDDFLDFSPLLTFPARKLSLGQRMRCEFAASLLHLPKILLLDEPTIGVDIHARQQIQGWKMDELLLLYGFSTLVYGVYSLLFGNFRDLKSYLFQGQFDIMRIRPTNLIVHIMVMSFRSEAIEQILFGIALIAYAGGGMCMEINMVHLLAALYFVACAVTILGGLALFSSSFLFITQGTFTPIGVISELREYTKYPLNIFGSVMQFVFSWIIPIGYVSYYPSIFLLGYPSASYFYAGFVAAASFLIGYAAFHCGLRHFNGVSA